MNLLDRDFNLKTHGETISIPLARSPETSELEILEGKVEGIVLGEDEFDPRRKVPRNLEEALTGKIPEDSLAELPRSFDIVGDIAVLELSPTFAPLEQEVARAILKIHPNVRAVFAKTGPISGSERITPLRHIAGENRADTVHREFGCSFRVDLSKVFFSPRLSTEHQLVARHVAEGEIVLDMFAGVGPFTILIAKAVGNVSVDAIDSNPVATKLLGENARTNKVDSKVRVNLGDAREVVRHLGHKVNRIIMNHPSAARDFVDAACEAVNPKGGILHYYTFAGGDEPELHAKSELESALKSPKHSIVKLLGVRRVREVAPVKWQIAIDAQVKPES